MAALSLTKYASISNYKKCGEILKSPIIGEKQFAMLCLQCHEICLQFQTFVLHIEKEHENCFLDVKTEEEYLDISSEDGDNASSEYDKSDSEEEDDKKVGENWLRIALFLYEFKYLQDFLMDPLGEPEVLLVKHKTLKEKDQICNRRTRQSFHESKRKPLQKILTENDVKQEPDDDSETFKQMSKEVRLYSIL